MSDKDNKNIQSSGDTSQDGFLDDFANLLEDNVLKAVKSSSDNIPSEEDIDLLDDFDLSFLDETLEIQKTQQEASPPVVPNFTTPTPKIDWEADFAQAVQAATAHNKVITPSVSAPIVQPEYDARAEKQSAQDEPKEDSSFNELYDIPSPTVSVHSKSAGFSSHIPPQTQPQPSDVDHTAVLDFNFEQELQNLLAEDTTLQSSFIKSTDVSEPIESSKAAPVADNHEDDLASPVFASAEAIHAPQNSTGTISQTAPQILSSSKPFPPSTQTIKDSVVPDVALHAQRPSAQESSISLVTPVVFNGEDEDNFNQTALIDSLEETLQELGTEFTDKNITSQPAYEASTPVSQNFEVAPEEPDISLAPDVSTFRFENKLVEPTQNFDIPNIPYHEANEAPEIDPLEQEFAEVFKVGHSTSADTQFFDQKEQDFFAEAATQNAAMNTPRYNAPQYNVGPELANDDWEDYGEDPTYSAYSGGQWTGERNDVYATARPVSSNGRRYLLLGGFCTLALILIGGAYYLFIGGSENSTPVTIQADNTAIKVAPEGSEQQVKPPEHQIVYNRASGEHTEPAQQGQLVDKSETPQDIAALNERVPSENDRLAPANVRDAVDAATQQSVQQRVVYTVVVNPDGSVVTRPSTSQPIEEKTTTNTPVTNTATEQNDDDASRERFVIDPNVLAASLGNSAASNANNAASTSGAARTAPSVLQSDDATPPASLTTPNRSQSTAPRTQQAVASSGDFYVQLSSQPTEDLARSELSKAKTRYSSIIGDRPISVQKADIPGKGTYYRVRVHAGSRENAISLCETLKTTGSGCFISR